MKFVMSILIIFLIQSCSNIVQLGKLTPEGEKVRTVKGDVGEECIELNIVEGSGTMEKARNTLRNKTADLGGNVVRLDTASEKEHGTARFSVTTSNLSGIAFKCP